MVTRLLPLLFTGLSLVAQPGPDPHALPCLAPLRAMNLTEAQKTSLHLVFAAHKEALKAKTEAARDARRAVGDALTQTDTTEAQLKALHDTAAAAQFEVLKEGRAMFLEVRPLLTPEQRSRAQELKEKIHRHLDLLRDFVFSH